MALTEQLEIAISAGRGARSRQLVRGLVPLVDAIALFVAAAVAGFDVSVVVYVAVTFVLLISDAPLRSRINPRLGDDAGSLLARSAIGLLLVVSPLALLGTPVAPLAKIAPAAVGLVLCGRAGAYALLRWAKASGRMADRTVIAGTGARAVELADILERHPEYGLRPVGFVGDGEHEGLPAPLLGALTDLHGVIGQYDVGRVLVALDVLPDPDSGRMLRALKSSRAIVHVVPRIFELGGSAQGRDVDDLWGVPVIRMPCSALRMSARVVKRGFDVIIASVVLALTAPMLALGAIAVRFSSPGPIVFRQKRIGRGGRDFEILKLRTMRGHDDSDTVWFETDDDRITPIGRILRRTAIDELPQLLNVIRGDMSIVGPRPERPYYVQRFSQTVDGYGDRHRVAGGITGWAQIHGRSRELDSIPERARFDNSYIDSWSLWRDIVIMLRTLGLLIRHMVER